MPVGPVRLRLQRFGQARTTMHLVAALTKAPARGKYLESLGKFAMAPDHYEQTRVVTIKADRVKYWIAHGAEPSNAAIKLLSKAGLLPPHPRTMAAQIGKERTVQGVDPKLERAERRAKVIENVLLYRMLQDEKELKEREERVAQGGDWYNHDEYQWFTVNQHESVVPLTSIPGHEIIMESLNSRDPNRKR